MSVRKSAHAPTGVVATNVDIEARGMNEFFPQSDYLGRVGFSFKDIRVTLVHAPDSNMPDNRGRYLHIAPEVDLAGKEPPGIVVTITDVSISDEAALRMVHAMLLAATGPEEESE